MDENKKMLAIFAMQEVDIDTLKNLSADTLKNLSADTLNNLSADTLKNLSADTLNNLSADTLNNLRNYKELYDDLPILVKPYTKLWEDIQEKKRIHNQKEWGPEEPPEQKNVCGTAMCTAGHLVNMAGAPGYAAVKVFGFALTATMIHKKSCADLPQQNYGSIPQEWALAFIESNMEREKLK